MKKKIIFSVILLALFMCLSSCGLLTEKTETSVPTLTPEVTDPYKGKDNYIAETNVESIKVTDPYGLEFEGVKDSKLLELFLNITKGAKKADYLGFEVDISKFYTVDFKGEVDQTYVFYFGSTADKCYFKSAGNKFYLADEAACLDFLNSEFSEGAYKSSRYPTCTVMNNPIAPTAMSWEYKKLSGEYVKPSGEPSLGGNETLPAIPANFIPEFTITPDRINIKVTDKNGDVVYEGDIKELAYIGIKEELDVNIEFTAVWDKTDVNTGTGSAEYKFSTRLAPTAVFQVDRTEAYTGEFIIMTCPNTTIDLNNVTITSSADPKFKGALYSDGDKLIALLPIPLNTESRGVSFTVNAYGNEESFYISLKQRKIVEKNFANVSEDLLNGLNVTDNPYPVFWELVKDKVMKNTNFARFYANDGFIKGYNTKYATRYEFGDYVRYGNYNNKHYYLGYDWAYIGDNPNTVVAMQAGKVVYVGELDYTGGLVIIDHGMGLLSWYWNLSTSSVSVRLGQDVKQGTVIGRNGGGGLGDVRPAGGNITIHIALTVFDTPVDLRQVMAEGATP